MTTLTKPKVCKNVLEGWNVEQFDDDGGCLVTIFIGPNAEARAHLYASKPNLLEALERVLPYFEGEHSYDHPDAEFARAAIAKAKHKM